MRNDDNQAMQTNADLDRQIIAFDERYGERVIQDVYDFLSRFVSYPSEHARIAHALWVLHAHMMDTWDSTPRIAFLSAEPASGKTRALEITELLVPNPVATVNVTPAYLFRKIGSEGGATVLYDEIDTVFGPKAKDNEDIRGLLNAGHRRGATVGRCVIRGNETLLEELPAYSAVALAGIGWLPDTLLSRSVIIRMRRRHAGERVEPFRRRIHENDGWRIRDQIAVWAKGASETFSWPNMPQEITDRAADVWEPLISVADIVGGDWPVRARTAAVALVMESKEAEPSLGIRLLHDLKIVFGDAEEMSSKAILRGLHALEEAPWSDIRGRPLDERGLANRLRQYSVRSKTVRTEGATPKGYTRADLLDLWTRYALPAPATSATSATSATTSVGAPCVAESSVVRADEKASQHNDVAVVADVADFGGKGVCAHCKSGQGSISEASVGGHPIWIHPECVAAYLQQSSPTDSNW